MVSGFRLVAAAFVCTCVGSGGPIVAPSAGGGVNTNNGFPFNIDPFVFPNSLTVPEQRYQQLYDVSQFATLSGPMQITGLGFLLDEDARLGAAFSSVQNVAIRLLTTNEPVGFTQFTFAANLTEVFNGDLTWSSGADRWAWIGLTTPFVYDPAHGNLLLDISVRGPAATSQFDAVRDSRVTSRVYTLTPGGGPVADSLGLVTAFQFSEVSTVITPEPGTLLMLGVGLALGWRGRCWMRS